MTAVRRHLASLGLVVALSHLLMQVLVPAALCCEKVAAAAAKAQTKECCPAGAHAGQVCPMHGSGRDSRSAAGNRSTDGATCHAKPQVDLADLLIALTGGGVLPAPVLLASPIGSESALPVAEPSASLVPHIPPGPPPRV